MISHFQKTARSPQALSLLRPNNWRESMNWLPFLIPLRNIIKRILRKLTNFYKNPAALWISRCLFASQILSAYHFPRQKSPSRKVKVINGVYIWGKTIKIGTNRNKIFIEWGNEGCLVRGALKEPKEILQSSARQQKFVWFRVDTKIVPSKIESREEEVLL